MNYNLCMSCFEIFNPMQVKSLAFFPRMSCGKSILVGIDDLMMDPIIILNKKRYFTEFCCSGHLPEFHYQDYETGARIYIDFIPQIESEVKNLVTGLFEFQSISVASASQNEFCKVAHIMPDNIFSMSVRDKMDYILSANKDFYTWACTLPQLEKEIIFEMPEVTIENGENTCEP